MSARATWKGEVGLCHKTCFEEWPSHAQFKQTSRAIATGLFVLKTYPALPKALDPYRFAEVFLFVCLVTGMLLVA